MIVLILSTFLAAACAIGSTVFVLEIRRQQAQFADERLRWETERKELLNRIQAPEYVPLPQYDKSDEIAFVAPEDDEAFSELMLDRKAS